MIATIYLTLALVFGAIAWFALPDGNKTTRAMKAAGMALIWPAVVGYIAVVALMMRPRGDS